MPYEPDNRVRRFFLPDTGLSDPPKFDPSQEFEPVSDPSGEIDPKLDFEIRQWLTKEYGKKNPPVARTPEPPDPEVEALRHLRAMAGLRSEEPPLVTRRFVGNGPSMTFEEWKRQAEAEYQDNGISRLDNAKNSFAQGALKETTNALQAADRLMLPEIATGTWPLRMYQEHRRKQELERVQEDAERDRRKRARRLLSLVEEGNTSAIKSLEILDKTAGESNEALERLAGRDKIFQDFKKEIPETYKTNPKYKDEFFASTLPRMAGSAVPVVGSSVVAGPAGPAVLGALGTNQEIYDEARTRGYTDEEAERVALAGLPLGALDGFGLGRVKFAPAFRNKFARSLTQNALEEMSTTAIQGLGKDSLAKYTYDPERTIGENLPQEILAAGVLSAGSSTAKGALEQVSAAFKQQAATNRRAREAEKARESQWRADAEKIEKSYLETSGNGPQNAAAQKRFRRHLSDPDLQGQLRELTKVHLREMPTYERRHQIMQYRRERGARAKAGKEVTFEDWYVEGVAAENQKWAKRRRDIGARDHTAISSTAAEFRKRLYGLLDSMERDAADGERRRAFREWADGVESPADPSTEVSP